MTERSADWLAMTRGEPFRAQAADLRAQKARIRDRLADFNRAPSRGNRLKLIAEFGACGEGVRLEAGIHIDLGSELFLGDRVYINAQVTLLDGARLTIGDDVLIGPGAQIYTVTHDMDANRRTEGWMQARPVTIGRQAWIGGGAIILPGVTVGQRAVVGAGAVVTQDVPDDAVVAGNPARVIAPPSTST